MTRRQADESSVCTALYVGTAGWNVPQEQAEHFSQAGTHLQRYGERFSAVEINSTFINRIVLPPMRGGRLRFPKISALRSKFRKQSRMGGS